MEFTPQRPRRARADPPSGALLGKPKSRLRVSPYADIDETTCTKLSTKINDAEAHASAGATSLADDEATAVSQPTSNKSDGATASNNAPCADHVGHGEAVREADQGMQEEVSLLVTNVDEGGHVEFEYNGAIYRVVDTAAFENAVAEVPKPPKRTLSSLRRAQRMARKMGATGVEHEANNNTDTATDAPLEYGTTSTMEHNALSAAVRAAGGVCADIPKERRLAGGFAFGPTVADELRGDTTGCV